MSRVAVVGGGLAGLAAAYRLQGLGLEPVVLEAGSAFGGKVQTECTDGLVLEEGPDSFLVRKPEVVQLVRELGLEAELVPLKPSGSGSAIYARGRLHPIPPGLMLGLPTEVWPIVRSGLLSPTGKLRAAGDFFLPRDQGEGDQPLGQLVARRLGGEVLDRLVAPLLTGIYAGDPWSMSTQATFPQLLDLVRTDGSLVLGARRLRRKAPKPSGPPSPMFMTMRLGLAQIVDALVAALPQECLRTASPVTDLALTRAGYRLTLGDGEEIDAEGVILTLPAPAAGHLLRDLAPQVAANLFAVPYASLAVTQMAYRQGDVPELKGSGFLVDRAAGLSITACTYVVNKWPHESTGSVLLRCYLGRAGDDPLGTDDEGILAAVRADLATVLGIRGEPWLQRVYRWPAGMPQYTVGHVARTEETFGLLKELPGLALAGAAYRGVGMPDVVRQANQAAEAVASALAQTDAEEESPRTT